ncbi:hypothetical protein B0H12DRAFT_1072598 [Mycena haematopus]|nr:hypothetical protein B0H12DRAFT_1072598 [Mycena haematopus]
MNLILLPTLDTRGFLGEWGNGQMSVRGQDGKLLIDGRLAKSVGSRKLYEVNVVDEIDGQRSPVAAIAGRDRNQPTDLEGWHRRLVHADVHRIERMVAKGLVNGLVITCKLLRGMCEDCILGKQDKAPFDDVVVHETEPLERVHIDLWGQARTPSWSGAAFIAGLRKTTKQQPHYNTTTPKDKCSPCSKLTLHVQLSVLQTSTGPMRSRGASKVTDKLSVLQTSTGPMHSRGASKGLRWDNLRIRGMNTVLLYMSGEIDEIMKVTNETAAAHWRTVRVLGEVIVVTTPVLLLGILAFARLPSCLSATRLPGRELNPHLKVLSYSFA